MEGVGFERERTGFLGEVLDQGSGVVTGFGGRGWS